MPDPAAFALRNRVRLFMETAEQEFISIIIPAYNTGDLLARCLDSVLAACDPDCEIIVVDDASTDDTAAVADRYQSRDPRVYLVRLDRHSGVGEARRKGVEAAQGDSIVFVDSDDMLPREAIAEMRDLSGPDVDIVVGNLTKINSSGTRTLSLSGRQTEMTGLEYAEHVMMTNTDFMLVGKKFRRGLFDKCYWDTSIIYGGLYHRVRLLTLACVAARVVVAPSSHVYNYYQRPFTLSSLIFVRPENVSRLWQAAVTLPVSRKALTYWGLTIVDNCLLKRGIPFDNEFLPAVELRNLLLTETVEDPYLKSVGRLLGSEKARLRRARRLVREGKLSVQAPHLSFIIMAHRNVRAVKKSLESILDTGFRNIEIVIVDDCSDESTSIELHSIAICNPRVVIEKNSGTDAGGMRRIAGLTTVTGLCVMYVHPGDTVEAAGVIEAMNQIDEGSQVSFMGCRYRRLRGMDSYVFDPSKCIPIHQGAAAAYDSLAAAAEMMPAIYGVMFDRRFIHANREKARNFDYDNRYKTVDLLNLLWLNPRISAIGVVGYNRNGNAGGVSTGSRMRHYYDIGRGITGNLRRHGLDDPGRLRSAAMGITGYVHRVLARVIATPVAGKWLARRALRRVMADPAVMEFYKEAGVEMPSEKDLIVKATDYSRRHRLKLVLSLLLNC